MKAKAKKLLSSRGPAASKRLALPLVGSGQKVIIVGIGASAGGLDAFTRLLKQLPADTGLAFVLVQHLDPQHDSALTQILARATAMPVGEATHNLPVEANHVYVIPPNAGLGISNGILKLRPRSRSGVAPLSIDFFLEALAHDQRERAIGIILSGTAMDGTLGLEAIKAEGGITFAQDESAKYNSMPRNAVAAGCVDFVFAPEEIAKELVRIAKHPYVSGQASPSLVVEKTEKAAGVHGHETPLPARGGGRSAAKIKNRAGVTQITAVEFDSDKNPTGGDYQKILLLLRNHSGVDFSLYKTSTIHRRITRRTVLNRKETLADYSVFLHGNVVELDALYSDALISVTSFFRNTDAFDVLQHKIFPRLLKQPGDEPMRIWVLGCSTGQEAYSIAMSFMECSEKLRRPKKLQIFATDLNDANLEKARHGLYAKSIAQDVSPVRLRRFFVEEEDGFRVIKALRDLVVFARQNLISDPPFSRMDLISCRNLMIYLEPSLQKKALPTFHYALKPGGFLFLGASESVGNFTDLFEQVDKKQKIYAKKTAIPPVSYLPVKSERGARLLPSRSHASIEKMPGRVSDDFLREVSAEREADRVTVHQFAPPGVLINDELQILQFRGSTGAFLEPPAGRASFDLLKMARQGLVMPLRTAINRAKKENKTVGVDKILMKQDDHLARVSITVVPLRNMKERHFLVLFKETEKTEHARSDQAGLETLAWDKEAVSSESKTGDNWTIAGLERDLVDMRDYLQSVEERQESANEELQASNEEGQSANEELQSLNEELETSKEELQSSNEELTTVNEEMVNRNNELNRLNGDLTNLQASTHLIILLLGRDVTIRRFSPQAEKQFRLLSTDIGRPFSSVRHNLDLPDLEILIAEVIASASEHEREVQDKDGHWYSLRLRPYLTADLRVDGVVLVLVDINVIKVSKAEVVYARDFAEAITGTMRDPLLILDNELRVEMANEAFFKIFETAPEKTLGRIVFELGDGQWDLPSLRKLLLNVLPQHSSFNDFEIAHNFAKLGPRILLLNARTLSQGSGHREKILLGIQDITKVLAFQDGLRRSELRYRRLFEAARDGIIMIDPVTRKITEANPYIMDLLGYTREQLIKKELWEIGLLKDEDANQEAFRELKENGFIRYEDLPLKSKGGQRREVEFVSNLYDEDGDQVIQCNIRDITERKLVEQTLRVSEERYRNLFNSIDEGFCIVEILFNPRGKPVDYRFLEVNPAFEKQTGIVKASGKRALEIVPDLESSWAENYGRVALSGEPARFTNEVKGIGRWFDIYAFRIGGPESRKVAILINNVTERKQSDEALRAARTLLSQHAAQLEGLVNKRTRELSTANRQLETSLASIRKGNEEYRAISLESQNMQKRLRQLTHQMIKEREEERKEISRELHDEVVQTLVGINVELSAMGKGASLGVRALKAKIAHTQRLVENSVNAVHRFARDLRPAVLDDLGLIPALHAFSKSISAREKIKIQITVFSGVEAISGAKRTVLFRVAQEALTNVVRHAHATLVKVDISRINDGVRMEIRDDGQSFEVGKTLLAMNNKRLGLVGMRERIEMVGGTLAIDSSPGKGTMVCAEIPFSPGKVKK